MKKLIISCLVASPVSAHPGHEHGGIWAHGSSNPELLWVLGICTLAITLGLIAFKRFN